MLRSTAFFISNIKPLRYKKFFQHLCSNHSSSYMYVPPTGEGDNFLSRNIDILNRQKISPAIHFIVNFEKLKFTPKLINKAMLEYKSPIRIKKVDFTSVLFTNLSKLIFEVSCSYADVYIV